MTMNDKSNKFLQYTIGSYSGALRAVLKSLREAEEITEICN